MAGSPFPRYLSAMLPSLFPVPSSISIWRSFGSIPCDAQAALVSARCLFSFGTLEVARIPESPGFALTECEHATVWRWAIVDGDGVVIDDGSEPTQGQAQKTAEAALRLVPA